ncbi:MAG: nuclear transport factor 2 family protein [Gammaproteobacteria bacterium]
MNDFVTTNHLLEARLSIEGLRRRYARAVDAMGCNADSTKSGARNELRSIFAPDAAIRFLIGGVVVLHADGPEAWADIVGNAVGKYHGTQHLIGTQMVRFDVVELSADGRIMTGEAAMVSHVQASHWTAERLRVVLGDYHDTVRFDPNAGWRIHAMDLVQHFRWERSRDAG